MTTRCAHSIKRRTLLKAVGSTCLIATLPASARATPASMQQIIAQTYGNAPIEPARVRLELPSLAENGNSVAVSVAVESAIQIGEQGAKQDANQVREITLFSSANPLPKVARLEFGPFAAKAEASFRIRLADTQRLIAIARMADGSLWSGSATTIVTLAACTDFLF